MSKVRIRRIRTVHAAPMGTTAIPLQHISFDSEIDRAKVTLSFDKDQRFIRVDYQSPKGEFELVPLANIASIQCDFVDEK